MTQTKSLMTTTPTDPCEACGGVDGHAARCPAVALSQLAPGVPWRTLRQAALDFHDGVTPVLTIRTPVGLDRERVAERLKLVKESVHRTVIVDSGAFASRPVIFADSDSIVGDLIADVRQFHRKFDLEYDGPPRALPEELREFRRKFLIEELTEYLEAVADVALAIGVSDLAPTEEVTASITSGLARALDALVDLVYVALGTAQYHGFNFAEAWRRVHVANMAKARATALHETKRGTLLDVVKPPGWQAPDLSDLVDSHTHREEAK